MLPGVSANTSSRSSAAAKFTILCFRSIRLLPSNFCEQTFSTFLLSFPNSNVTEIED